MLIDDPQSWKACTGGLDLDGFRYTHIRAENIGEIRNRISWLASATCGKLTFSSQPWRQFAQVLRENGDDSAARKVLMAREAQYISHEQTQMRARYEAARTCDWQQGPAFLKQCLRADGLWLEYQVHRLWSCLKRLVIGYGYDPKRPLYCSVALIALGAMLAHLGWQAGVFAPASDQILTSPDWLTAMAADPVSPTQPWLSSASAQHYEAFSPFLFALDTYLPVMDLGQERSWAVTTVTTTGSIGRALWVVLQAAGWIVTSLGIAAVAGLVQKGRND
ncbi:hypothetical protein [Falsigemmobacter faecalis]|uniref:Uncharacterized protein n=1 Tax=Falsigemmobacter faecalis TaxID=2488730 RepID=A0A3P3DW74_9RHOB|nr:hypothetical protein [Falsigemmobacter faecalis]RRH78513.1 hypothetical protein EG244_00740 [Falsigemmobacter faecalis]